MEDATILTGNRDVDRLILLELDDLHLRAISTVNTYMTTVCNEEFWRQKVERTYGEKVAKAKRYRMTYSQQYWSIQSLSDQPVDSIHVNRIWAAIRGRMDLFIVYKHIWNNIEDLHHVLDILMMKKRYGAIIRKIISTYEIEKQAGFVRSKIFITIMKNDSVGAFKLMYEQQFPIYPTRKIISDIMIHGTGTNILRWILSYLNLGVDIFSGCYNMLLSFNDNNIAVLRIIKILVNHNIVPTVKEINSFMGGITISKVKYFMHIGIIPTVEGANMAARRGSIMTLKLLGEQGILPDDRGANKSLSMSLSVSKRPTDTIPVLKWMYDRNILPSDERIIRRILSEVPVEPERLEKYNWIKEAYGELANPKS